MRIQGLSPKNRPRERMVEFGKESLSEAELLSIILEKGYGKKNVLDIANDILSSFNLEQLSEMSVNQLKRIYGMGPVKSMKIVSMFEFVKRYNQLKRTKKIIAIKSPKDVYNLFIDELREKKKEHLYVLLLDTQNSLISKHLISVGTLNSSLLHPREIFNPAIKESANAIILIHNHPTGNVEPSIEDKQITNRLKEIGELLGIPLLDHVIIGKENYASI